jgi:hypothetical protein
MTSASSSSSSSSSSSHKLTNRPAGMAAAPAVAAVAAGWGNCTSYMPLWVDAGASFQRLLPAEPSTDAHGFQAIRVSHDACSTWEASSAGAGRPCPATILAARGWQLGLVAGTRFSSRPHSRTVHVTPLPVPLTQALDKALRDAMAKRGTWVVGPLPAAAPPTRGRRCDPVGLDDTGVCYPPWNSGWQGCVSGRQGEVCRQVLTSRATAVLRPWEEALVGDVRLADKSPIGRYYTVLGVRMCCVMFLGGGRQKWRLHGTARA